MPRRTFHYDMRDYLPLLLNDREEDELKSCVGHLCQSDQTGDLEIVCVPTSFDEATKRFVIDGKHYPNSVILWKLRRIGHRGTPHPPSPAEPS
jgi:hypothetical protein